MAHQRRIVTPYEGTAARDWDPRAPVPAPLTLHRCVVRPSWVDYNQHMSESCYLLVFGDSADAFFRWFGIDEAYRATGRSLFTAETHLHHVAQASEGDPLRLDLRILDLDAKRVHVFHEMLDERSGRLLATAEQLLLHYDSGVGAVSPIPEPLAGRLAAIRDAHAGLDRPAAVGHRMGIPHRPPVGTD